MCKLFEKIKSWFKKKCSKNINSNSGNDKPGELGSTDKDTMTDLNDLGNICNKNDMFSSIDDINAKLNTLMNNHKNELEEPKLPDDRIKCIGLCFGISFIIAVALTIIIPGIFGNNCRCMEKFPNTNSGCKCMVKVADTKSCCNYIGKVANVDNRVNCVDRIECNAGLIIALFSITAFLFVIIFYFIYRYHLSISDDIMEDYLKDKELWRKESWNEYELSKEK